MFDFIENAVRDFAINIQDSMTNRSLAKALEEFDEWEKEYNEHARKVNALDPDSSEARKWIMNNRDLPEVVEKKICELPIERRGVAYFSAYSGMGAALAAFRSILLNDEEGFPTWHKDSRIGETSIRFFFGKKRYDNYGDFSDDDVPPLKYFTTSFENKYELWVSNEMLEEAFRRVQGDNPEFKLEIDIAKNIYSIKPVEDTD